MKHLYRSVLLISCFAATSASAQTAEQTVAYILHGLEAGANSPSLVNDPGSKVHWEQVSDRPLLLLGKERFVEMKVHIEDLGNCVFRDAFSFSGVGQDSVSAGSIVTIDLRNASGLASTGVGGTVQKVEVQGAAYQCSPDPSYTDMSMCEKTGPDRTWFFGNIDRAKKALTYLQKEFCKSGAF